MLEISSRDCLQCLSPAPGPRSPHAGLTLSPSTLAPFAHPRCPLLSRAVSIHCSFTPEAARRTVKGYAWGPRPCEHGPQTAHLHPDRSAILPKFRACVTISHYWFLGQPSFGAARDCWAPLPGAPLLSKEPLLFTLQPQDWSEKTARSKPTHGLPPSAPHASSPVTYFMAFPPASLKNNSINMKEGSVVAGVWHNRGRGGGSLLKQEFQSPRKAGTTEPGGKPF